MAKKTKKPFDPFEVYRAEKLDKRKGYVLTAIRLLKTSKFTSMTKLAAGVARIVTEFEFRDAGVAEKTDKVRGCDSSALLRKGSRYKQFILEEWELREGGPEPGDEGVSELEALKVRCGNLSHHNDLLLKRLEHKGQPALPGAADAELEEKNKKIKALLDIVNGMYMQVSELFTTVLEGDEDPDEHPVAGLYGPDGFVVGIEELQLLQETQNEQRD